MECNSEETTCNTCKRKCTTCNPKDKQLSKQLSFFIAGNSSLFLVDRLVNVLRSKISGSGHKVLLIEDVIQGCVWKVRLSSIGFSFFLRNNLEISSQQNKDSVFVFSHVSGSHFTLRQFRTDDDGDISTGNAIKTECCPDLHQNNSEPEIMDSIDRPMELEVDDDDDDTLKEYKVIIKKAGTTRPWFMHIPERMRDAIPLENAEKEITIRLKGDPSKEWLVRHRKTRYKGKGVVAGFAKGWREVSLTNNLKEGDAIFFRLIDKENWILELRLSRQRVFDDN